MLMATAASGAKKPSSRAIAAHLSELKGIAVSEENARQIKKRAKDRFSRQLVTEIGTLIGQPDDLAEIERAATDLGMIDYCRKVIDKPRG